jgi:hypothetical protein
LYDKNATTEEKSGLHPKFQQETLTIVYTKGKQGTHENSRDTAEQESVRVRKKGKVGKRGRKPKELLGFPSSRFSILPAGRQVCLCYTRV